MLSERRTKVVNVCNIILKNKLHNMQQVKDCNNSFLRKLTQAVDSV